MATTPTICAARPPKAGARIVIPPERNRPVKRAYDTELYEERNGGEVEEARFRP